MKPYDEFLAGKQIIHKSTGFTVEEEDINPLLFPHQNALTRYALRKGKSAILADTGLGKTVMELEWARIVADRTDKPVLIVMPLYVAYQTIDIAKELFNQDIAFAKDKMSIAPSASVYVTNYNILHKFQGIDWGGLIFDESSIFKGEGKFFNRAKELARNVPYVLLASATPNPNSPEEMGMQSEVLGIMTTDEMKSKFFINRQDRKEINKAEFVKTAVKEWGRNLNVSEVPFDKLKISKQGNKKERQGWQLAPHAKEKFYKWLASWAMAVKLPSDIGFSNEGYVLPKLTITPVFIKTNYVPEGQLVFTGLGGVGDRSKIRKLTLEPKCQKAIEIIGNSKDQWIVWCGLNPESNRMAKLLKDHSAVNVQGSDKIEKKIEALKSFTKNEIQILISKGKICGHGSNFQNCHKTILVGLSDSWELFYQMLKRMHRFKQLEDCEAYVLLAEEEREIWENVKRKGEQAEMMTQKLIENASQYQQEELDMEASQKGTYVTGEIETDKYHIMLGDSCERLKEIETNSIGLSVYSPPFEDLFTFSNTERDLGNSATPEDFYEHYNYIIKEILRVTMPGRKTMVHAADIHARKSKDGFMGLIPFSDRVVTAYSDRGWDYNGRIPIAKNPQATAIRLKAHELMFATMKRDAARLMPVQPDYFLVFTKPGNNENAILPKDNLEMTENTWIEWAGNTWLNGLGEKLENDDLTEQDFIDIGKQIYEFYKSHNPIWDDINETKVLQHKGRNNGRLNEDDTRHICPLQLEPVERAIKLWSNPGDRVLTPFMGIGTEVYQAVMFERYGIGIELKPEYFNKAYSNIEEAVRLSQQEDLFSLAGIEV